MHKPRTPWPVAERAQLVGAFEGLRRRQPGFSARRFSEYHEVPYATFCRWLARFRSLGARGLADGSHAPRHRPSKLSGKEEELIRRSHRALRCGVHRLYAYLKAAKLTTRSFASVYRVLSRCGALVKRRRRPKPNWTLYAKAWPGERAQMDIKYLPEGRYQLTLIDDCSRLTAATVMTGRTQADVISALPRLLGGLPLQTALRPDRQRLRVRKCPACLARGARHPPRAHPSPSAAPQRQSRTRPTHNCRGVLGRRH